MANGPPLPPNKEDVLNIGKHVEIESDGTIKYLNGYKLHREDGPAIIHPNGDEEWRINSKLHRIGGPARTSGYLKEWFNNGLLDRKDGPAKEYSNGTKEWFQYGKHYREDNLPTIELHDGTKKWLNTSGQLHNEEGPAVINPNGKVEYYINGIVKDKIRKERAELWNGRVWVLVEWNGLVLRLDNATETQDNTIWVYSENYEPLFRPMYSDISGYDKKALPAATYHDINEGLPPPETGLSQGEYELINQAGRTVYDKNPLVFFKNYDLYETEGVDGKAKAGPGKGIYGPDMGKYKSVSDFRKRKQKARRRRKMALLLAVAFPEEVKGKKFKPLPEDDENNLQDPYEDQGISPLSPISPAEIAPLGLIDGMTPRDDFEGKPPTNLYYGVNETHFADDGKTKIKSSKSTTTKPA